MNSMYKTGIGFREVEESVQCIEDQQGNKRVGGSKKYYSGQSKIAPRNIEEVKRLN